ncbi:MAG: nickel-dependent lactate racemase [Dehalococcoidia bacterium]|nr:MAG: nickel-dependent lactate racemase [Dehalococcoidia bacterium]
MKVHLPYGRQGLEVELPTQAQVLLPERVPALVRPEEAVRQALRQPIGSPPLAELVRPTDRVAIVFSDITRPTPNHILLPAILAELAARGVPKENVALVNATGMHRPNTREELIAMLGQDVVDSYRIVQHDARDREQQTFLSKNERGAEIWINGDYMRADVRILTGFVEPHMFAGYSGGGKAVLPGIADAEIIMSNHGGSMLAHPRATWCHAEGNPVFEEARRVALATQPAFIVNVTLNERKEVTGVFAGEMVQAHDAGIAFAERAHVQPLHQRYDIVVSTNMGYPADINLYQSVKGMSVAAQAVKEGGAIVLAAECADGLGQAHYAEMLAWRKTPRELLDMVLEPGFAELEQWAIQCQTMVQVRADVYLYSSLGPEQTRRTHLKHCRDINETVAALLEDCRRKNDGNEPSILVLPFGQLAVPRVEA